MSLSSRLTFLRNRLGLRQKDVSLKTEIPLSSYRNLESGAKTCNYEYILKLSMFFNLLWVEKYGKFRDYPRLNDLKVEEITTNWLMFGRDPILDRTNKFIQDFTRDYRFREQMNTEEIKELKEMMRQLLVGMDGKTGSQDHENGSGSFLPDGLL